jgi:hypothetical protein
MIKERAAERGYLTQKRPLPEKIRLLSNTVCHKKVRPDSPAMHLESPPRLNDQIDMLVG